MNSKIFFYVMVGVTTVLGLSILGAVYVGNKMLVKQSNNLSNHKLESQVAEMQQTLLTKAKKDIAQYSELKGAATQIVPQDKDQAAAVREIVKIAGSSGVKLGTITFPSSTLGQKTAPAANSNSTSGSASSSAAESKKPPVTQVVPVAGIKGVYAMPITVQSDPNSKVSYTAFINFLKNLENNRRTAQVSSITITPDKQSNNTLGFTLVLNAYIKP